MKKDEVLYALTVEDFQTVAEDYLGRKLSESEVRKVCDKLGNFITWDEAIIYAIGSAGIKGPDEDDE
ncbi:MAG: hypothetical protein ABSH16_05895 [Sedimentisphaerales bacterium]